MPTDSERLDWSAVLADQVDGHWQHRLRPRLEGLTDEQYRWQPVAGAWNVRPAGSGAPPGAVEVGGGPGVIDFALPEPVPPPLTTIAWRLGHVLVGVLGERDARYFGGEPVSHDTYDYPLTAADALARLEVGVARWVAGVRSLGVEGLSARCQEPGYEREPMAGLVLHVNRELLHHLAEVALLRDLWAHRSAAAARA